MGDHRVKITLQLDRIRRGIQRFLHMISDLHIQCANDARFAVSVVQYLFYHVGCRCLAVCPGNSDQFQLLRGISEKGVCENRQNSSGIRYRYMCNISW